MDRNRVEMAGGQQLRNGSRRGRVAKQYPQIDSITRSYLAASAEVAKNDPVAVGEIDELGGPRSIPRLRAGIVLQVESRVTGHEKAVLHVGIAGDAGVVHAQRTPGELDYLIHVGGRRIAGCHWGRRVCAAVEFQLNVAGREGV